MEFWLIISCLIIAFLVFIIFNLFKKYIEVKERFKQWEKEQAPIIRQNAIKKSQDVIRGKVIEHLVPYFPELLKFNPRDVRFLGSPIDLIIFHGLDEGNLEKIIFIEVKTGKSTLNQRELSVKNRVLQKKVGWETIRINR